MIEFEAKIKGIAVPVKQGGYNYFINNCGCLRYSYMQGRYEVSETHLETEGMWYDELGKANLEIIGLTSEILKDGRPNTVDLRHKIIESREINRYNCLEFKDYIDRQNWFNTSRQSFQSLLDKYNIVGDNLILQRL